ncbi:MAG: hypothetical protein PHC88_06540 [Terrimicrobiaceae bacterium]|nr:hypothetical protein [Terrimicrobiaceae bacterium]
MKKLAFFLLATLAVTRAPAATAYEALQVIKKNRGDAILKQLVEVRGETGQPQPESWTILMSDPAARAGIREFVVTGKEIASERTPLHGHAGDGRLPVLDFARLNLDSDGAFRLANQQAARTRVGFHTIDYTLRTDDTDGAPMWVLHLFDHMGAPVGTLQVSAESGKVVRALQIDPDARVKPTAASQPAATPSSSDDGEITTHFPGGVFGFVERSSKQVGRSVKKATLTATGAVQEFLTGERTIGVEEKKRSSQ